MQILSICLTCRRSSLRFRCILSSRRSPHEISRPVGLNQMLGVEVLSAHSGSSSGPVYDGVRRNRPLSNSPRSLYGRNGRIGDEQYCPVSSNRTGISGT